MSQNTENEHMGSGRQDQQPHDLVISWSTKQAYKKYKKPDDVVNAPRPTYT